MEKQFEYAIKIQQKIGELFDKDSDGTTIDDLQEDVNLTHFFHALANLVPTNMFNKITGEEKNHLEFNHIANQLVFQYSKKED